MSWISGSFSAIKKEEEKDGEKDEENSKNKASFPRVLVFNKYLELNF